MSSAGSESFPRLLLKGLLSLRVAMGEVSPFTCRVWLCVAGQILSWRKPMQLHKFQHSEACLHQPRAWPCS